MIFFNKFRIKFQSDLKDNFSFYYSKSIYIYVHIIIALTIYLNFEILLLKMLK